MTKVKRLAKIREIPIEDIDGFPDHPYKVRDDEEMAALVESIRENGVMTPAVVRRKKGGRYELLSGHRRKRACELLWRETLRCEIVEIDDDEAIIFMCDSNLYRTRILPSEKAFSYKMKLDAMKRQGKRNDLTCATSVHKLERSRNLLAKEVGESHETVRRYIRLTELIPEILKMVDEGEVGLRPAVEISYLPPDLQEELLDCMEMEACKPNHAQTLRMRMLLSEGKLTPEAIAEIIQEEKPNQREKIILRDERVRRLLPKDLPVSKREEYIIEALEYYGKFGGLKNESMDTLRNWERNGLLQIKRKQNGYHIYTGDDMERLKMIRTLRLPNYSLEAILRMLNALEHNPQVNLKQVLNTPQADTDIVSVCDRQIVSLNDASENAKK